MPVIDDYIKNLQKIKKYYAERIKNNLDTIKDELVKHIEKIIDKHAYDYNLLLSNSVYHKIPLFSVGGRVKTQDSLYEKYIRKDKLYYLYKLTNEDENDSIKNKIIMDEKDIIGIKITTNLTHDCINVFKIIKEKEEEFENIKFILDKEEIPTEMKNGRKIYKMECEYIKNEVKYSFELQIKSKIDSAWGDLEHNLFYKDYDFYYTKNSNKIVMNITGDILEKLENLMYEVRGSKAFINEDFESINFYQSIDDTFKGLIKEKFGTAQMLEDYIPMLYSIYKSISGNKKELNSMAQSSKSYFDKSDGYFDTCNIFSKKYNQEVKRSCILSSLDNIYLNFYKDINQDNYDNIIVSTITRIIQFKCDQYMKSSKNRIVTDDITCDIHKIISNPITPFSKELILNDKKFDSLLNLFGKVNDIEIESDNELDFLDDPETEINTEVEYKSILKLISYSLIYLNEEDNMKIVDDIIKKTDYIPLNEFYKSTEKIITAKHKYNNNYNKIKHKILTNNSKREA